MDQHAIRKLAQKMSAIAIRTQRDRIQIGDDLEHLQDMTEQEQLRVCAEMTRIALAHDRQAQAGTGDL